tara:strand:+ start:1 stop:1023 length:1023 start_codon:yes stop_codon:yes gene_type:complete
MGGMIILFSVILPTILFADMENIYIQITLISTLFMGIIGLIDDYLKVVKKYSKGLIARYKILAQVLLGLFIAFMMINNKSSEILIEKINPPEKYSKYVQKEMLISNTEISVPFMPDKRLSSIEQINKKISNNESLSESVPSGSIEVGLFLIIISIFVVSGSSNSINLTDGIDGLASGLSAIVFFTLGIIAYASGHYNFSDYLNITYIQGVGEVTIFCMSMVGACLGFLWFNAHPAQVFMGDTGSLSLGAAMGAIAIILKKEILLVIIAGVFVVEALSVILQVGFFKYSKKKYGKGKRLFLMAPLHHHFELKGIDESKIVIRFWIIGILLALLSIITLKVQ